MWKFRFHRRRIAAAVDAGQTFATVGADNYLHCSWHSYRRIVMRRILLAALFSLGLTGSVQIAGAQSKTVGGLPVESVTVLAIKPSSDKIKDFVQERVAPSHALN